MNIRGFNAASLLFVSLWLAPLAAQAQPPAVHNLASAESTQLSAAAATNASTPPITVQIAPPPISISSAIFGISAPLGAQPASGKPMYAEFVTEHHQSFTDGNRISRSTTSCIYRDAQGRIRRESQLSVPGLPAGISTATFITIVDQKLGYGYVLNPQEMVAHRYELNGAGLAYVARLNAQGNGRALLSPEPAAAGTANSTTPTPSTDIEHWRLNVFAHHLRASQDAAAAAQNPASNSTQLGSGIPSEDSVFAGAPTMRMNQPFLAAPNPVRIENLGEQTILGFRALGTRVITTLPAGQIGNERPIDIVSEQWFSPDLDLVTRSLHRDPWAGEFTTTVTKVTLGDQDASLFKVPAPYKIVDAATEGEHHVLDSHDGNHPPAPAP